MVKIAYRVQYTLYSVKRAVETMLGFQPMSSFSVQSKVLKSTLNIFTV